MSQKEIAIREIVSLNKAASRFGVKFFFDLESLRLDKRTLSVNTKLGCSYNFKTFEEMIGRIKLLREFCRTLR